MGEVWRAHDPLLGRDVAVKVLPELLAGDPERIARFEREARALAALNHPNVAQIYEVGEATADEASGAEPETAAPRRFLVMELVDGRSVAARLGEGRPTVDEVVRIALGTARGVDAAHRRGVIHRDLKPANIQLTPGGDIKVVDFGLARFQRRREDVRDSDITQAVSTSGVVVGTAAYMAPEQVRGEECDERCDVWAFGCCLGEMLTGHRVFAGANVPEIVGNVMAAQTDLSGLPTGTPRSLRVLLERCLQHDRQRRPRMFEVVEQLEGIIDAAPTRRRKLGLGIAAAVVAVGVVAAILLWPRDLAIRRGNRSVGVLRVAVPSANVAQLPSSLQTLSQLAIGEITSDIAATNGLEAVTGGRAAVTVDVLVLAEGPLARLRLTALDSDSGVVVAVVDRTVDPARPQEALADASGALREGLQREAICRELEGEDALHGFLVRRTTSLEAARNFRDGVQRYIRVRLEEAGERFEASRRIDPSFWPAYVYLAQVHGSLSRFREGREVLREARAMLKEPQEAEAVIFEVAEALMADDDQRLLEALVRARRWFPDSGELTYRTAWAYRRVDRPEESIPLLKQLIKDGWQPDWSPTWEQLAMSDVLSGDLEGALETATNGEQRFPQRYMYPLAQAWALQQLGRGEEAREAMLRALRKRLDFTTSDRLVVHQQAYYWAALLRWPEEQRRQWEMVLGEAERRLAETPNDVTLLLARGEALSGLGRYRDARAALESFSGDEENEAYRLLALARARFATGDASGARAALDRVGERWRNGESPALGTLAYNIGCAWTAINEPEVALQWLLRARDQHGVDRLDLALDPELDQLRRLGLLDQLRRR